MSWFIIENGFVTVLKYASLSNRFFHFSSQERMASFSYLVEPNEYKVDLDLTMEEETSRFTSGKRQEDMIQKAMANMGPIPSILYENLWKPFDKSNLKDVLDSPLWEDFPHKDCVPKPRYLEQKNPHERDHRLIAIEEPHTYFLDGSCDNIISSTSFVHAFFPPFDTEKCARDKINSKTHQSKSHQPSYDYYGCETEEDVVKTWSRWACLGTKLHARIEAFIQKEPDALDGMEEENKIPFNQFLYFWEDNEFIDWEDYRVEFPVLLEKERIPGKIDYLGYNPKTKKYVIVDWKRSNSISDACIERFKKCVSILNNHSLMNNKIHYAKY